VKFCLVDSCQQFYWLSSSALLVCLCNNYQLWMLLLEEKHDVIEKATAYWYDSKSFILYIFSTISSHVNLSWRKKITILNLSLENYEHSNSAAILRISSQYSRLYPLTMEGIFTWESNFTVLVTHCAWIVRLLQEVQLIHMVQFSGIEKPMSNPSRPTKPPEWQRKTSNDCLQRPKV